jgi:1-acyl-sn-glycerol-3-phosphate acyltransferase
MVSYFQDRYRTAEQKVTLCSRLFPSLVFYCRLVGIVLRTSKVARAGGFTGEKWVESSLEVLQRLEEAGISIEISGVERLSRVAGPVVIVANHMSMMETLLLPGVIQPIKPVTFVVKESLLSYPVFKHVMQASQPIAVTRTNPRQDLKTVLGEGSVKLSNGISVIVFPQTTRSHHFDPAQMSSIGVKLAKKAGVPIVPLALQTDAWQNGRWLKDFGRLDSRKTARFAFGKPLMVEGKGDAEQTLINGHIAERLQAWSEEAEG